jgi:hypothetical protein
LTLYLLPLQTPGCRGRLPWANLPKQKEPPHRGDIGWGRFLLRQFDLYPLAYDLNYKLCDNKGQVLEFPPHRLPPMSDSLANQPINEVYALLKTPARDKTIAI